MSLLELSHVSKSCRVGMRRHAILHDVSLTIEAGELVAVWGRRGSGRTTLLRVAAGVESADSGSVRFRGRDIGRGQALGAGIGYCATRVPGGRGHGVLEDLAGTLLARGLAKGDAQRRAAGMLERVEATHCAAAAPHELEAGEAVRVALARALASEPRLIVVDEPTRGVDLLERDELLALLRSLAAGEVAVLMSTAESPSLSGADRALALSDGQLRGALAPELAEVVPLRRRASA